MWQILIFFGGQLELLGFWKAKVQQLQRKQFFVRLKLEMQRYFSRLIFLSIGETRASDNGKSLHLIQHLCSRLSANQHSKIISSPYLIHTTTFKVGIMMIFLLKMRKLSHREGYNTICSRSLARTLKCYDLTLLGKIFIDSGKVQHPTKQSALILEHFTDIGVLCKSLREEKMWEGQHKLWEQ